MKKFLYKDSFNRTTEAGAFEVVDFIDEYSATPSLPVITGLDGLIDDSLLPPSSGSSPTIFGSVGTPLEIDPAIGFSVASLNMSSTTLSQIIFVAGLNTGENSIVSTPQIQAHTIVGAEMTIKGENNSKWILLDDGNGLDLIGQFRSNSKNEVRLWWNGSTWSERSRRQ